MRAHQYTAGPWSISRSDYPMNSGTTYIVGPWDYLPSIAKVHKGGDAIRHDANARLIAAAPDLLKVLLETLNWCEVDAANEDGYPSQEMLDARAERLRDAIAKAL